MITLLILTSGESREREGSANDSDSFLQRPTPAPAPAANGFKGRTVPARGVVHLQVIRLGCVKKGQTRFFFFSLYFEHPPLQFTVTEIEKALAVGEPPLIVRSEDTSARGRKNKNKTTTTKFRVRVVVFNRKKSIWNLLGVQGVGGAL